MKTRQLFHVMAVLSPIFVAATFSVKSMAQDQIDQSLSTTTSVQRGPGTTDVPEDLVDKSLDLKLSTSLSKNEDQVQQNPAEIADEIIAETEFNKEAKEYDEAIKAAQEKLADDQIKQEAKEYDEAIKAAQEKLADDQIKQEAKEYDEAIKAAQEKLADDQIKQEAKEYDEAIKTAQEKLAEEKLSLEGATKSNEEDSKELADKEIEQDVNDIADQAENLKNLAEGSTELTEKEVEDAVNNIEDAEKEVSDLEGEVDLKVDESEKQKDLKTELADAKDALKEAKEALKAKDAKIEKLEEKTINLNKIYCEQKVDLEDLTKKVAGFESDILGPLNQNMEMMNRLMMMQLMSNQGPKIDYRPSYGDIAKQLLPFGSNLGVNMLSLTDLFNSRSLGGLNYNVYNVGGNMVGGDFSQALSPLKSQNQIPFSTYQGMNNGLMDPTTMFNFTQGLDNQNRGSFAQLDAQNSMMARNRVQQNLAAINAQRPIGQNQAPQRVINSAPSNEGVAVDSSTFIQESTVQNSDLDGNTI